MNAPSGPTWRRRIAPLLLMAAGLGIYLTVGKRLPHEQTLALDLGRHAAEVTALELTLSEASGKSDEPAASTRWNFAPGTAPPRVYAHVKLADGPWNAEVAVQAKGERETQRWSRRVDLGGDQVVLPLGEALP